MTEKKEPTKKPLDMTSDEAIDFLFGEEGAKTLKEYVRENFPPHDEESESKASASSRKEE